VVADLPKAYAPYEKSFGVKEDGKYVKNTTPSTTLGYQSTKLISSLTSKQGFSVSLTLQTFNDTASAVAYYNTVSTVNNTLYAEEKDSTVGILTGIGDAASYYTSAYTNQYDSNYNNITWNVTMVTSNLVTSFIIETPSTYTADELKSFLTQWTKKLTTYKQASDLEFQKELQQSDVK
jgi:hypothetical protein